MLILMLINPTYTYCSVYCQLGFACETMQDCCQLNIKFVVELQRDYIDGVVRNIIAALVNLYIGNLIAYSVIEVSDFSCQTLLSHLP